MWENKWGKSINTPKNNLSACGENEKMLVEQKLYWRKHHEQVKNKGKWQFTLIYSDRIKMAMGDVNTEKKYL